MLEVNIRFECLWFVNDGWEQLIGEEVCEVLKVVGFMGG